jgi:chemotaxis protein CheX
MFSQSELVGIIQNAAIDVFTTMLSQTPEAGQAYTQAAASLSNNGVVSFVGLAGPWVGTGSISCSAQCAAWIASQMMMTEYEAVNDEVLDAMAEVTNMIIGNVKTSLEERVGAMGLSIPTVIYGRNFESRAVGRQEWTVVPFTAAGENLEIHLCLAPGRDSRPRFILAPDPVQV